MARQPAERGTAEAEGQRRRRRAAVAGGTTAACVGAASLAVESAAGVAHGIPWPVVVPFILVCSAFAGWAGARTGRENAVRAQTLGPGERLIGSYAVRPPFTPGRAPTPYENPPYQLLLTSRHLQLWERSNLLWARPWPELRLAVDGPRLKIYHRGEEAGFMVLEPPGTPLEVQLAARRLGAS
ncbi:hypothetical protein ACIRPX_26840 [Streptomyces sp. NPDC101225]|uniref:hypothetical protein n=1 Tax=Streptomyces sp. NPDC101225 TaxID=3366135 RepID=UPI00382AF493